MSEDEFLEADPLGKLPFCYSTGSLYFRAKASIIINRTFPAIVAV